MSEDFGLGALESPPDPRDYPLQLAPLTAPLPSRFLCDGMPPVLNQGKLPMCVAFATSGMLSWFGKIDAEGVVDFDEPWIYRNCKAIDGIVGAGTDGRSAMRVVKNLGARALNRPEPATHFRVAAYYAVPVTATALKTALMQYGPVLLGSRWFNSWFRPVNGIIDKGTGGVAGGHATLLFGWDNDAIPGGALYVRNSWGFYPGSRNGNFLAPTVSFLANTWEAWKATDAITKPPGPR
jgi:hypothetical protein